LVLLVNAVWWTTQALTALRLIDIVSYPDGTEAKLRGRRDQARDGACDDP